MKAILAAYKSFLEQCQGCGQCQSACPMLDRLENEAYGPRGHVAQLLALLAGRLGWDDIKPYIDTCLLCGQCSRACPAALPLERIFQAARFASPLQIKIASRFALAALTLSPVLLDKLQPALAAVQKKPFLLKLAPKSIGNLPPLPNHAFVFKPERDKTSGKKRILLFPGCIGHRFFPQMLDACVKVLQRAGFEPFIPKGLSCCGRPDALIGRQGALVRTALRNLAIFSQYEFDFIVTPCPECQTAISRIWPELPLPPDKRKEVVALAAKAFDIASLLRQTTVETPEKTQQNIFWHQPCLMGDAANQCARELAGCADSHLQSTLCCGLPSHLVPFQQDNAADNRQGVPHQKTSRKNIVGMPLLEQILDARPEMIATSCPGCMLEICKLLRQGHARIPVCHSIELYARAIAMK